MFGTWIWIKVTAENETLGKFYINTFILTKTKQNTNKPMRVISIQKHRKFSDMQTVVEERITLMT